MIRDFARRHLFVLLLLGLLIGCGRSEKKADSKTMTTAEFKGKVDALREKYPDARESRPPTEEEKAIMKGPVPGKVEVVWHQLPKDVFLRELGEPVARDSTRKGIGPTASRLGWYKYPCRDGSVYLRVEFGTIPDTKVDAVGILDCDVEQH